MNNKQKKEIEKVIKVLLLLIKEKKIQMFDCYDITGDFKETLFDNGEVEVLYAPGYKYVEIIGLDSKDYDYFFKKYGY